MTTLSNPRLILVRPVTPRTPNGCEKCLRREPPGTFATVSDVRARRPLRLISGAARQGPCIRDRAPDREVVRAG